MEPPSSTMITPRSTFSSVASIISFLTKLKGLSFFKLGNIGADSGYAAAPRAPFQHHHPTTIRHLLINADTGQIVVMIHSLFLDICLVPVGCYTALLIPLQPDIDQIFKSCTGSHDVGDRGKRPFVQLVADNHLVIGVIDHKSFGNAFAWCRAKAFLSPLMHRVIPVLLSPVPGGH